MTMSSRDIFYVTSNHETAIFPNIETRKSEANSDETCCIIGSSGNHPKNGSLTGTTRSLKEQRDVWSYNSIFGEDAESLLLESSMTGNSATMAYAETQETRLLSHDIKENALSDHSSPLDINPQTFKESDSIDFLGSAPNPTLPRGNDHLYDLETQLMVNPSSVTNNTERKCFIVDDSQDGSDDDAVIDETYLEDHDSVDFLPCSQVGLSKRKIEESYICETQIEETCVPLSAVGPGPSPPKKKKIVDVVEQLSSERNPLTPIQLPRNNSPNPKRPSRSDSITEISSPYSQQDLLMISRSKKNCINMDVDTDYLYLAETQLLPEQLIEPCEEPKPIEPITTSNGGNDGTGSEATGENLDDTDFEDETFFESQSKRESSVIGSPDKDDEFDFLRGRSPSPVETVIHDCPSPVFLVPSDICFVRKRKMPNSSQQLALTQQTQEIRPLSFQLPTSQEFEHHLNAYDGKTAFTSTQVAPEVFTQMTQEMEPLSLQMPNTQEFEQRVNACGRKMGNQQLESMTQMTQEMEPLSLQMPNTQEFERRVNACGRKEAPKNQNLDLMTQMTQEIEPLSLQLPETQEFQRNLLKFGNRQTPSTPGNAVASTQQTQEMAPLSLQLPSTQDFLGCLSDLDTNENHKNNPQSVDGTPGEKIQHHDPGKTIKLENNVEEPPTVSDNPCNRRRLSEKNLSKAEETVRPEIRQNTESIEGKILPGRVILAKRDIPESVGKDHCEPEVEEKIRNVAFSNNSNKLKTVVKNLGGAVTEIENASVFVCDTYRMTWKMKIALDKKIPVVSSNWLTESKMLENFQSTVPYILQDCRKNKK